MRLHRFFVEDKIRNTGPLVVNDPSLVHQWRNVFRFEPRTQVILCDDTGIDFVSQIDELTSDSAKLTVLEQKANDNGPIREAVLFAAITKKDTFEWVVEKATELGASKIIPVIADRSEKKDLNFERLKKIIREASEQSGRATLPRIYEIMKLENVLKEYEIPIVAFHPEARKFERSDVDHKIVGGLIGPEGGWSERELKIFEEKKIPIVSLGHQVLRAETASVAILTLMLV